MTKPARLIVCVLVAALVACAAGCGGGGGSDESQANAAAQQEQAKQTARTARFLRDPAVRVIRDAYLWESRGQFGRAWDSLHPAHQALVSRGRFEECMRRHQPAAVDELDVLDSYRDALAARFVPETSSTAVTLKAMTVAGEQTFTAHAVNVGGRWRWVLSNDAARSFKRGGCGA